MGDSPSRRHTTADELCALIDAGAPMVLIDVREDDLYGGHISVCRHVPNYTITYDFLERIWREVEEQKLKHVVFCCSFGRQRSVKAVSKMLAVKPLDKPALGGVSVTYLEGGFSHFSDDSARRAYITSM
eukprot:JZ553928.1.p2 GENE.JZ553928.1~~JZ553928.1.p2  ORF type:complete len:144 (+),score=0.87 JZ553928.1:47-433(+)